MPNPRKGLDGNQRMRWSVGVWGGGEWVWGMGGRDCPARCLSFARLLSCLPHFVMSAPYGVGFILPIYLLKNKQHRQLSILNEIDRVAGIWAA